VRWVALGHTKTNAIILARLEQDAADGAGQCPRCGFSTRPEAERAQKRELLEKLERGEVTGYAAKVAAGYIERNWGRGKRRPMGPVLTGPAFHRLVKQPLLGNGQALERTRGVMYTGSGGLVVELEGTRLSDGELGAIGERVERLAEGRVRVSRIREGKLGEAFKLIGERSRIYR
jgi:hypothetical protein